MQVSCPHAARCPGCPLITLPYAAQLELKTLALRQALGAYPTLASVAFEPIEPADPIEGYRVRAKLVVKDGKLGLFARASHDVVDIPECPVLRPPLRAVAQAVRARLSTMPRLSSVDLRETDDGVLVTLAAPAGRGDELASAALAMAREVPEIATLALSEREQAAPRVVGTNVRVLEGPTEVRHRLEQGAPFHYAAPGAFTQLHAGQATRLHEHVEERLRATLGRLEGARVLELYAGSGALGLRLAERGARVTLVESFVPALRLAERAAREQGLDLRCVAGDAGAVALDLARDGERFDAVLVNPPRRGIAPAVRRLVAELAPKAVLYVSCAPPTLARDADHLARLGQRLVAVEPFDMIPLSDAVEALAAFTPRPAPPPPLLFENDSLVAVAKAPHEPTTPQGEHAGSLLDRVRALDGCARAVPVHRLDLGTSGVCLFARAPEHVPALANALSSGSKEYVALVRGITRAKGAVRRSLKEDGADREAYTRYTRLRVVGGHALVRVFPEQGRTHQIRRHLAGIAHPVLGDARYGDRGSNAHFEHRHGLDRSFLHLERVAIRVAERELVIESPLAPDLGAVLASLETRVNPE